MASTLAVVGIVLCVGWGVWWWLLNGHLKGTADLQRKLDELEKKHEPK